MKAVHECRIENSMPGPVKFTAKILNLLILQSTKLRLSTGVTAQGKKMKQPESFHP
jgi:hypothetical protein